MHDGNVEVHPQQARLSWPAARCVVEISKDAAGHAIRYAFIVENATNAETLVVEVGDYGQHARQLVAALGTAVMVALS